MLDLIIVRNDGRLTRVAPDTTRGQLECAAAEGTTGLQVGRATSRPRLCAGPETHSSLPRALAPGEKQLTLEYQVPSDRSSIELPFGTVPDVPLESSWWRNAGASAVTALSRDWCIRRSSQVIQEARSPSAAGRGRLSGQPAVLRLVRAGADSNWCLRGCSRHWSVDYAGRGLASAGVAWYAGRRGLRPLEAALAAGALSR